MKIALVAASIMVATVMPPLLATSDLAGRVLFAGLPVPGAVVSAARKTPERRIAMLSDQDGAFRLADLEDGAWEIRIEMRGFVTSTQTVTMPVTQPLEVTLVMQSLQQIAAAPPSPPIAIAVEGPPVAAAAVDPSASEPSGIIAGSLVNGAASAFAQTRTMGNNRPNLRALYTGGITAVLGNSAWNARPYSFPGSAAPSPSYSDVNVGLMIGGPLKIPWLVQSGPQTTLSYTHSVANNATSQSALMPTLAERSGDFSEWPGVLRDPRTGLPFPGNVIPPAQLTAQAKALLLLYPPPGGDVTRGANFQASILGRTTSDAVSVSMSKGLTSRINMSGSFNFQLSTTDSTNLFGFTDKSRQSQFNAQLTMTRRVSNRLQFSVRYQGTRASSRLTPFFADRTNISGDAGITGNSQDPSNWGPPTLLFPDIADLRDGDYQRTVKTTHTGSIEALLRRGRHNLRIGGDLKWSTVDVRSQPDPRGTLSFTGAATGNALADFLLGIPSSSAIAFGKTGASLRAPAFDAYIEDDFRVNAGLTMNLGVRWEYEAPYREAASRLANLDVAGDFSAVSQVLGARLRADWLGIQPRVALSWRPMLGSSLVLRGSYGLYRNLGLYQSIGIMLAQQPPFLRTINVQNTPLTPLTLANPFPDALPDASTFAIDPGFRPGSVHSWQLSAQRDFAGSLTMIAAYFGDRGTNLTQAFLPNTYAPGAVNPCPTCPSGFVYVTSNGTSLRNAGQFTLRRRLYAGFTATAQYTIAKSTDNAATFSNTSVRPSSMSIAQNWLDLEAERGPSSFDQRHLGSFQLQYSTGVGVTGGTLIDGFWGSLYKDWTLTSQFNVGSGLPLTPMAFVVVPGTGTVGVRPSLTGVPPAPIESGSYVNPAAFTMPAAGTWGNAGRNSIRGPSQLSLDASIARVFRLRGRWNLEWRVAATNVLNRVTFSSVNTVITSPQFGLPTSANAMRRIQTMFRVRF
jgi:trimeric autotransporter adhesin